MKKVNIIVPISLGRLETIHRFLRIWNDLLKQDKNQRLILSFSGTDTEHRNSISFFYTSDLKTHEYRCKDHSQILPHQNCREIQLAHSPSRIVLFPSIEHPVFNLVQTYSDQGWFQIVFLQIRKKSLKILTTTESDIFFVCDIDLKIDTKTLDRIRMNTGDNKVYFPMFFRLVDYTVQSIHHWEAPKPCKNGSIGFFKSNVNHEVIISLELQEFQNKMDSGDRFRSECLPWIRLDHLI